MLDGQYDYWVRAIGGGESRTRYVTQDYPRTGTVFQANNLSQTWTWHKMSLAYWEGDMVHFELATAPDIPLMAGNAARSWFGTTAVRMVKHDSPAPADRYPFAAAIMDAAKRSPQTPDDLCNLIVRAIEQSVRAWQSGSCSDSQSELIDHCLRLGLLPNNLESLEQARPLIEQYRKLESAIPIPRRVPGLDDTPSRSQPLYVRGNHKHPDTDVPRRFLEAIDSQPYPAESSGRLQFAEDLLRDDNPLSRRVIVNRIWHHLFGKGLVETPDNFGQLGGKPTHPELLDWLAVQFVEDGWSLKRLIRLIATSQTWQQSSEPSAKSLEIDPDNSLLSHANVRRLEAEAIRDAMLRATDNIDLAVQGSPVDATSNRRSIFIRVRRNSLDPMLRAFDFPEPHSAVGRRDATNVPAQSLLMMNSPQVAQYAADLAQRVRPSETIAADQDTVAQLYLRLFARLPTSVETKTLLDYVRSTRQRLKERQIELADLNQAVQNAQQEIAAIMEPKRQQLNDSETRARSTTVVTPLAQWEFDKDLTDHIGNLEGQAFGGAAISDGNLIVNNRGYVNTQPLTKSLRARHSKLGFASTLLTNEQEE